MKYAEIILLASCFGHAVSSMFWSRSGPFNLICKVGSMALAVSVGLLAARGLA